MKAISYINILSLDVVLGAVSCSLFLGSNWQVNPSWHAISLLACVVWLIYTFDHLKDVYGKDEIPDTGRHNFHAHHFTSLIVVVVIVLLVSLYLLYHVKERVLRLGSGLTVLVGVYFLMLHFLKSHARFHKEIVIALLYAAGVCIPPLAAQNSAPAPEQWVHFGQLAGLALGNLLCFSLYEYDTDKSAGFPSLMQVPAPRRGKFILVVLLLVQVVVCLILWQNGFYPEIEFTFALMAAALLLLTLFIKRIKNEVLFRLLGDAVFIIPLVVMLLE